MRLIFRVIGTWLVGLALILLIIDGTKSLAANAIVVTTLGENWTLVHAQSLAFVQEFLAGRMFKPVLEPLLITLLGLPGFAVLGVPGLVLAFMGRSKRSRQFIRQDQV